MATIYNLLRSVILDRWNGEQCAYDIDLGCKTVRGWYYAGEDLQLSQQLTIDEKGSGVVSIMVGCSTRSEIAREDRLSLCPAENVAPLFRARCEEALGSGDVVYIQDLGALAHGKVVMVAVRDLPPTDFPPSPFLQNGEYMDDSDRGEDNGSDHGEDSGSDDGQLSIPFDDDEISEETSPIHTSDVCMTLAPLSERYLRYTGTSHEYGMSAWDGKMHRTQHVGAWAVVMMVGTIACLLMVLALQQLVFTTYEVMHFSLLPLLLMPLVLGASFYVWNYRRAAGNALRSAMADLKNHRSGAASRVREFIDAYSGSRRNELMEVYYQVF